MDNVVALTIASIALSLLDHATQRAIEQQHMFRCSVQKCQGTGGGRLVESRVCARGRSVDGLVLAHYKSKNRTARFRYN